MRCLAAGQPASRNIGSSESGWAGDVRRRDTRDISGTSIVHRDVIGMMTVHAFQAKQANQAFQAQAEVERKEQKEKEKEEEEEEEEVRVEVRMQVEVSVEVEVEVEVNDEVNEKGRGGRVGREICGGKVGGCGEVELEIRLSKNGRMTNQRLETDCVLRLSSNCHQYI